MKRSQYLYLFDIDNEYVGYSYLSDSFVSFPIEKKERYTESHRVVTKKHRDDLTKEIIEIEKVLFCLAEQ